METVAARVFARKVQRQLKRSLQMGSAIFIVVAALTLLVHSPALGQMDFSVDRQRIDLSVMPGGEVVGSFRVANHTDAPLPIRVTPVDYAMNEFGQIVTPEAGTTERSLLPYLVVSPTSFTLEPGGFTDVRYVVNVPDDFDGSHWIAFLTRRDDGRPSSVEEQGDAALSIQFRFHLVYRTLMVVTAKGTERSAARVTGIEPGVTDEGLNFHVNVRNEGNVNFRADGRVEIRDSEGMTVSAAPLSAVSVLPGHERTLTTRRPVDELSSGDYIALAIVDFGGDYLTAGQLRFSVP